MALTISEELLHGAGFSEREALVEIACRLYDAGKLTMPQSKRASSVWGLHFKE
jgi:predicted HTH domain antitoxin